MATPGGVQEGPGVVVVEAGNEQEFLRPLPVQRLWGVGPVTLDKLHRIGVRRVADLVAVDEAVLASALGQSQARHLLALARGVDDRPVEPEREAKSIGHEETFETDKHELSELRRELVRLSDAVAQRLRRADVGARTLTLKLRFDTGFQTITRSVTCPEPTDLAPEIVAILDPRPGGDRPEPRGTASRGLAGRISAPWSDSSRSTTPPRRCRTGRPPRKHSTRSVSVSVRRRSALRVRSRTDDCESCAPVTSNGAHQAARSTTGNEND